MGEGRRGQSEGRGGGAFLGTRSGVSFDVVTAIS